VRSIAAVFARGGSKGVPDKNLRILDGRPLITHAIEQALECPGIDRVLVSTDSPEIARTATAAGGEVPWLRPAELSTDTSREWQAWQHLVQWLDSRDETPERLLVVPCTAPLRRVDDLARCLEAADDPDVDIVLTVTPAHRNPWFNMVQIREDGSVGLVIEPATRFHRRQDAPRVFDVGTVAFVADPAFVRSATSLYDGRVRAVEVPAERSLDIDTESDLAFAEFLIERARHETGADHA